VSDDPRLPGILAPVPDTDTDTDRANERDRRLADLTARLRADNQRFAERATAPSVENEFSSADEDHAQKRRSRFWELMEMLTSRERRDSEPVAAEESFPNDDRVDDPRGDERSVIERAALEAIAEALSTPDPSRDLVALQDLAEPHPYEPIKRAQRPLPLIEGGPVFAAPLKGADDTDEQIETAWQEIRTEALKLLQAQSLVAPASHLAYIQERIKPVLDHGAIES
jgi:hypothetical protein